MTADHLGLGGIGAAPTLGREGRHRRARCHEAGGGPERGQSYVSRLASGQRAARVILFSMETRKTGAFDRVDGFTSRGGAAFVVRRTPDGDQVVLRRPPDHAGAVHPPDPGDVRRQGQDERRERAGGGRGRRGPPAPTSTTSSGPDLRPRSSRRRDASTISRSGRSSRHRLLPQRRRHGRPRRLRDQDGRRQRLGAAAWRARDRRHRDAGRPARRGHARVRLAAGRGAFDEIIVRGDRNLQGRSPGATATLVADGVRSAKEKGTGRTIRVDKVLDELTAVKTARSARTRATSW